MEPGCVKRNSLGILCERWWPGLVLLLQSGYQMKNVLGNNTMIWLGVEGVAARWTWQWLDRGMDLDVLKALSSALSQISQDFPLSLVFFSASSTANGVPTVGNFSPSSSACTYPTLGMQGDASPTQISSYLCNVPLLCLHMFVLSGLLLV